MTSLNPFSVSFSSELLVSKRQHMIYWNCPLTHQHWYWNVPLNQTNEKTSLNNIKAGIAGEIKHVASSLLTTIQNARKGVHFRHCSWRTVSKSAGPRTPTFSCCKILIKKTYRARELRKRIYLNVISDFAHGFKFCGQMLERTGSMTALWLMRLHLPTLPVGAFLLVICFMCGFYD